MDSGHPGPGPRPRPTGAARVPEVARPSKSSRLTRCRLVGGCRLVARGQIQTGVLRTGWRGRQFDRGDQERTLGIRIIQSFRYLERCHLNRLLILLASVAVGIQPTHDMTTTQKRAQRAENNDSLKIHAAWSSKVTPAARIARTTASWCAGANSTNGNRIAFPMRPIRATAHFTGTGLASKNRSLCNACKCASTARARAKSPLKAA
jgi:hypothetical protein